jgi:predicted O-methyltransferase YrrM
MRVRAVRERVGRDGPGWQREAGDFARVALPARDCDLLRDLLIAEGARTVVEVGLAYGSSALAIGEALLAVGRPEPRQLIIDPFQDSAYRDTGWGLMREAGLDGVAVLERDWSSIVLPRLLVDGFVADAAFVDGSHRFHEVFLDLYYLRKIVRPGGLIVMDDYDIESVRTAARYYERNLGWSEVPGYDTRGRALRLPTELAEPWYEDFRPF